MMTFTNIRPLREQLKEARFTAARNGKPIKIALVPTMGFLHEGHASLLRKARAENDLVVLSIFVNPIQFGPNEDFERYPRDPEKDLALAEREGVDFVFLPSVEEMYPQPTRTNIKVADLTDVLCGASRPGHFDGVTTVVGKLLHIVQPDRAYFGQKDAQQVAVIAQMVLDLNFDVEIVPCPIVRESDGLALSSRNVYLSAEERQAALVLSRSLLAVQAKANAEANVTAGEVLAELRDSIGAEPLAVIDYVEIADFPGLSPLAGGDRLDVAGRQSDVLIAVAVKFGKTRLIDNVILTKKVND
ncbi:pantoate--beta-alanine ligase [Paenibacillus sp. DXFW5]|uniref:Pantothenate synthetase n=1 Tax=Paenibacillus rhizolycopersici TaxID=2780073 RepID=A0ABS2H209_9BACL|nr:MULTISPECIES: pantoate--beta-alanine ligase [Paenibacillus]MBM6995462.1 pantoate--beta-alanine ligase [Paenibacillus rhizolycopersici]GIP48629.1 pantothenate synthetase [Paenibacillus sp. J53TS2]